MNNPRRINQKKASSSKQEMKINKTKAKPENQRKKIQYLAMSITQKL